MRTLILLLLATGFARLGYAQDAGYKPMHYSVWQTKKPKAAYIKSLSPRYLLTDKKYVSDWNDYLYDIYLNYNTAAENKQFINEAYVVNYLDNVLQPILKANGIQERIDLVVTRYQEVNAYNMGDNRLYVNIGVLQLLENEAQLAFLLCHELSHYLLQHGQEKFRAVRDLRENKEVKAEMKDINAARYNKLDRASQFAAKYSYTFANYSTTQERAADSMAIVLLRPTKYDIAEGKGLMRILEMSDSDRTTINYAKYLSAGEFKLRPEILAQSRYTISFGHKRAIEFERDSLKSHPDIPLRIAFIGESLQARSQEGSARFVVGQSTFDSIKHASSYEIIESYEHNKRYAAMMYQSLARLSRQPDDKWLLKKAAFSFRSIVQAVRDHTIQDHAPGGSESNGTAYNNLLRIIDRTKLPELIQLYNNFLANYSEELKAYPELNKI